MAAPDAAWLELATLTHSLGAALAFHYARRADISRFYAIYMSDAPLFHHGAWAAIDCV